MKEKILAELKNKFKNLGFGEKAFDGVADYLSQTVTEEAQIETAIGGVESLLKVFQGDIDARVTAAVKKVKDELKPQPPAPPAPPVPPVPPAPPNPPAEVPEWAKAMISKLETLERKETQAELSQRLNAKLKGKVPEAYLRGRQIKIDTEADIDTLATTIEQDYTAFKQELINEGVIVENPKQGQSSIKAGETYAVEAAKLRNERGAANNPVPGLLDNVK